jgi:hypothetical protein
MHAVHKVGECERPRCSAFYALFLRTYPCRAKKLLSMAEILLYCIEMTHRCTLTHRLPIRSTHIMKSLPLSVTSHRYSFCSVAFPIRISEQMLLAELSNLSLARTTASDLNTMSENGRGCCPLSASCFQMWTSNCGADTMSIEHGDNSGKISEKASRFLKSPNPPPK